MLLQTNSGALAKGVPNVPGGTFNELLITRAMPEYYQLVKSGRVFVQSALGINPTAFVGGAAGTPIFGVYNPAGSGVDLTLLEAEVGVRTTGSVAATLDFNHFAATMAAPTGNAGVPRNLYSMSASGSAALTWVNAVNTAALASNFIRSAFSLGAVAAAAALNVVKLRDEIKGQIIVPQGAYYAFGSSATLTGASLDCSLIWAETPA